MEIMDARIPVVRERLQKSANGYVLVRRFGHLDKGALRMLIDQGSAEIFDSPLGRAYRLIDRCESGQGKPQ